MIIVTTDTLPDKTIRSYLGVVSAEVVVGENFIPESTGTISEIVGGRSETYELMISTARKKVLEFIEEKAAALDCNAVLGLRFSYQSLHEDGGLTLIAASGTAVRIEES
jgi:uncharacterized protein YbjQ (UPF0145 family)